MIVDAVPPTLVLDQSVVDAVPPTLVLDQSVVANAPPTRMFVGDPPVTFS
jgi:hypothetical protein